MIRQTLVMTRPRAVAERFVAGIAKDALAEVDVIYAPLVEIVQTGRAADLDGYTGAIFTSSNGVAFAPKGDGRAAFCVGAKTAVAASSAGWDVEVMQLDAESLIAEISTAKPKGPLVHLAGRYRRGEIDTRLGQIGIHVDVQELYDQPLQQLDDSARMTLSGEGRVILPLFSPRTAAHLGTQIRVAPNTFAVVMSEAVAESVGDVQFAEVHKSTAPTGDEMTRGIEMLLRHNRFP